ncbi:MAG: hypothetical protein IH895_07340 [Planctomycetes bacterium]|nr:hypothetical protein [Planctomycetota bacterium]
MTRLVMHSIIATGLSGIALLPRPVLAMTLQSEQDNPQHSALSTQHSALDVVERFVEYVQQRESYPETARRFVAEEWQRRKDGTALRTFIPEALAVLHPRFKIGLDAYEARQYGYCAKIMGELSLNSNRYLSSYAALFQTKALVQEVQLEYAAMLLNFYLREDFDVSEYCLDVAEMKFLQGYCLFHTFQIEQARDALNHFLEDYPESDPALRASARELLQSMSPPPRKDLGQVAHLMAEAGLWLTEGETGIDPQIQQAKALMILEEMIRNAQQQERQQQQQRQGQGQPSAQQAQTPQRPAEQSALPQGKATQGQLHSAPRAAPGEVWGSMKPQQRARILQVLQENFPNRYRQLVEQYYKELAREQ